MDEFVQNILTQWNLSCLNEKFKQCGIDEEVFRQIDNDFLDQLFDKSECGFRKKFEIKLGVWKSDGGLLHDEKQNKCYEKSELTNEHTNDFASESTNSSLNHDDSLATINHNTHTISTNNTSNMSLLDLIEVESTVNVITVMPNRPVKKIADLLKCTVKGKIIMQTFKLFKNIDTRLLSDLVIDNEFEISGYRITKERFIGLARELAEIFVVPPKTVEEAAKLFYYHFQKATAGHKCVSAGGILYDKYFNYRRKLIHCQLISPDEQQIEDTPIEFAEHAIKWLEVNDKPEQEVITKWNNTFHLRVPCKNVKNYFLQFKCLRSTFGYILLSYDFDTIYPNAKTKFKEEWDTVAPLIIRCAKSKNKLNPSDEELKN
ncbi:uncharacterized protein LOC143895364 [Temnothorax americanus]|uniref:uncharacterized protein LOC143895364 n=1 Tax=Temnothorax americanus TaxID=1964332 RepID=UPI00406826B4